MPTKKMKPNGKKKIMPVKAPTTRRANGNGKGNGKKPTPAPPARLRKRTRNRTMY